MPSRFETYFFENAMPMLQDNLGIAVKLKSGVTETAEFVATYSKREDESVEFETGLPLTLVSRDWFLPAADLVIGGTTVAPKAGMRIVEQDSGDEYEIQGVRGMPAVEEDLGGLTWTCHSARVTTV